MGGGGDLVQEAKHIHFSLTKLIRQPIHVLKEDDTYFDKPVLGYALAIFLVPKHGGEVPPNFCLGGQLRCI